ncbi:MAG: phosphate acyltransferase PlsX [Firmicutes bacterium]|nr:phosphate acyltransferase PlsX [Bacillota bacterium]
MYTIAIDAMGGDFAPDITVRGSVSALRAFDDLRVLLVGQAERIQPLLEGAQDVLDRAAVVDAREIVENTESPVMAIRHKTDSSLVRAIGLVREGEAAALVSAGSTGAVMAGGLFRLGRIKGVERPALAAPLPTVNGGQALLVDVGANVDCLPEYLLSFARMGSAYMRQVMGVAVPRVALLGIGEEAEKGNQQTKAAYALLRESGLHFVGNLEARGVPMGEADVVVVDGFAGNILLKSMEGITKAIFKLLKEELHASGRAKVGAMLAKGAFSRLKSKLDPDEVGGAPLLGVNGAVIKAHGNSGAHAFFCAIRQARSMLEGDVVNIIRREGNHSQS